MLKKTKSDFKSDGGWFWLSFPSLSSGPRPSLSFHFGARKTEIEIQICVINLKSADDENEMVQGL
jgi:hypothetical protein